MAEGEDASISTTNTTSNGKIDWNDMEWYEDIFDVLDENQDALEFTTEELNRYFTSGHINAMMCEEEMIEDDSLSVNDDIELLEQQEEVLSQQFSQLSTKTEYEEGSPVMRMKRQLSTSSNHDVVSKKIKLTHDNDDAHIESEQDEIPDYLLTTDKKFVHMIQKVMDTCKSIEMNDSQQMAILMHHIAALNIQKEITTVYLRSGTGKFREIGADLVEIDRRVWPMQVKSAMSKKHETMEAATAVERNEQLECETLVYERLQEFNGKIEGYERQLNETKSLLIGCTSTIEEAIKNYVQQYGIRPLQMKRDLKIALLEHDYDAEILERKYSQEKPSEYQLEVAHSLYQAKYELEKSKRELLELTQRVFYNKPPSSFDSLQLSSLTSADTTIIMNNNIQKQLIRRKKLDLIAIHIAKAQLKYYESEKAFTSEYKKMQDNHRNLVKNKGMPTRFSNLIEQRLTNITDKFRDLYNYRINYCLRSAFGDLENLKKMKTKNDETEQNMQSIGLLPNLISDTTHQLNDKQIQLLMRGPTYVPPCQMHIASTSQSIDDIVKKQYAPLKHQLASLFSKYHINIALSWEIQTEINQKFSDRFSMSIPENIYKRAIYEQKLVQSIRYSLKKDRLILRRTADNQNTFYLGNSQDFEVKSNDYLTQNDAYKVLMIIDEKNTEEKLHSDLNERIQAMNLALETLKKRKALNGGIIDKLLIDAKKVKLPYVYFLPDISKENEISVVPRIVAQHSVTSKIAKYIEQLIRPFADEKMRTLTFCDEADFMQKLHYYTYNQQRLTSTTLFCTIKITNFYTLDQHETMIDTVTQFLRDHSANNKINQVSIMTIKNLLQLFLYNNLFCFNNKVYTIMKGSPNTMPLSDTLSSIYLFDWQQMILKEVKRNNELFGRYKDEIFFTWNGCQDVLRSYLQAVKNHQKNVHFQLSMGLNVRFLNAYIENREGQLYSRVYHDPSIQSYILPYVVGHSKLNHSEWLRSALIRAVCYCSSVEDFHQERIHLEVTCLVGGYSFLFVETHVQHFFNYFNAESMRYRVDQTKYHSFRSHWFDFLEMQRTLTDQLQKLDDNGKVIRLNYLYDYGPRCQFNQEFHHCWSKHFNNHPILSDDKSKIILTTTHLHSLNALLARHKSSCWIHQ